MTILTALARAYDRMAEQNLVPPYGYSEENISFVISLNLDGTPAGKPHDLRLLDGKKRKSRRIPVPMGAKRTAGVFSFFLWDKTAYVLGVTAGEGKRLETEHEAFKTLHRDILVGTEDEGLQALLRFLDYWTPDRFTELDWPEEMLDQNIVFALEVDRLDNRYLHDRPEARRLWTARSISSEKPGICLVTGESSPVARLHPSIKGVWGAQSSGASLVSFNLNAFESYGHSQGDNAPVGEAAAFAYGTALNKFLETGSGHRVQIGDASTVFWADGSDAEAVKKAELAFACMTDKVDDEVRLKKIAPILQRLRSGRGIDDFDPGLGQVRFYVLGLAPNAARLSVRFWIENDFGTIAANYARFMRDIAVEPGPRNLDIGLWGYLIETAVQHKSENIPPNLAGTWMRAILTGTDFPLTLMSGVLMRIRADGQINAQRVGMLKSVLIRTLKKEDAPVALDPDNRDTGYLLGRLFAVYERAQTQALGSINATIKDKFYGAASAQPAKVFPVIDKGAQAHLSKLGKTSPGFRVVLERTLGEIMDKMSPNSDPFPRTLPAQQQALFALGYYHQRQTFFVKHDKAETGNEETAL
jgi:CRISPR-associated protein Csd1